MTLSGVAAVTNKVLDSALWTATLSLVSSSPVTAVKRSATVTPRIDKASSTTRASAGRLWSRFWITAESVASFSRIHSEAFAKVADELVQHQRQSVERGDQLINDLGAQLRRMLAAEEVTNLDRCASRSAGTRKRSPLEPPVAAERAPVSGRPS